MGLGAQHQALVCSQAGWTELMCRLSRVGTNLDVPGNTFPASVGHPCAPLGQEATVSLEL